MTIQEADTYIRLIREKLDNIAADLEKRDEAAALQAILTMFQRWRNTNPTEDPPKELVDQIIEYLPPKESIRLLQAAIEQEPDNLVNLEYKRKINRLVTEQHRAIAKLLEKVDVASAGGDHLEAQRLLRQVLEIVEIDERLFGRELELARQRLTPTGGALNEAEQISYLQQVKNLLCLPTNTLSEIEARVAQARELIASGQGDRELEELVEKLVARRAMLLSEMSALATLRASGRLLEYIQGLESLISMNVLELYDYSTRTILHVMDVLSDARKEYRDFCTRKAEERIQRAAKLMPDHPTAALYEIQDAIQSLVAMPPDLLEELQYLERNYLAAIAQAKVAESLRTEALKMIASSLEMLNSSMRLLQRARGIYQDLPGLKEQIAGVKHILVNASQASVAVKER